MSAADTNLRAEARSRVLAGLERLRAAFPLEQRVLAATLDTRNAYAKLLDHWARALPPTNASIDSTLLAQLAQMDAVVLEGYGLGCYPFSSRDTGIWVTLPDGVVNAMCAFDALAMARLVRARVRIDSVCENCTAGITIQIEENGGLDHDQTEVARVIWLDAEPTQSACSQGLCRNIRFLCRGCAVSASGEEFTLPQAAAIANAFFRFQSTLLAALTGRNT